MTETTAQSEQNHDSGILEAADAMLVSWANDTWADEAGEYLPEPDRRSLAKIIARFMYAAGNDALTEVGICPECRAGGCQHEALIGMNGDLELKIESMQESAQEANRAIEKCNEEAKALHEQIAILRKQNERAEKKIAGLTRERSERDAIILQLETRLADAMEAKK